MSSHRGGTSSPQSVPYSGDTGTPHGSRKGTKTRNIAQNCSNKQGNVRAQCKSHGHTTAMDTLPDDVLFEIIDLYQMCVFDYFGFASWNWYELVWVCQKWRRIIFSYTRRLKVQLFCFARTPVRRILGLWPACLLALNYTSGVKLSPDDEDGVYAALEHPNRVCRIKLYLSTALLEKMTTAMQKPFPVLTSLSLFSWDGGLVALPEGFLARSAPCLRELVLHDIPFPALPTLLSSASNLVDLRLLDLTEASYISPGALVTCLAILPKLNRLSIELQRPTSHPDRILLPETRVFLPCVQVIEFGGSSMYLEDLVARIDAPQLDQFTIDYAEPLDCQIQVPQLSKFIGRLNLKMFQFENAVVYFQHEHYVGFAFRHEKHKFQFSPFLFEDTLSIYIPGKGIDQQASRMTQVLSQTSAMLAGVAHLEIQAGNLESSRQHGIDEIALLELLRPFTAVKTLRVPEVLAGSAALALEEALDAVRHLFIEYYRQGSEFGHNEWAQLHHTFTTVQTLQVSRPFDHSPPPLEDVTEEMVADVLPTLGLLFLEFLQPAFLEHFVAFRWFSGSPVTIAGRKWIKNAYRFYQVYDMLDDMSNIEYLRAANIILPFSIVNDPSPGSTSHAGLKIAQGRSKKREDLRAQYHRNETTIAALTDNALVEIFDFCRKDHNRYPSGLVWKWHSLVHVCQRWRQIIFASPRRLNLQILCTDGTPVRKDLGIWPAIPIVMQYGHYRSSMAPNDEDNAIAALEHPDRVCRVKLYVTGSQLGKIVTVMQEPFTKLARLSISSEDGNVPVLPEGFLGRSAPCLQEIELYGVPFPSLPTLLLSASDLVELKLRNSPQTGYISPEAMVACLAALPRLEILHIGFQSPDSRPDQTSLPPITRTALPALHYLFFSGVCAYFEDFVARIDTLQLDTIVIFYSDQDVDFDVPQLSKFIDRSENLKRTLSTYCSVILDEIDDAADFSIGGTTSDEAERWDPDTGFSVSILCEGLGRQMWHLTRVLSSISPVLSDMVHFALNSELFVIEPLPETGDMDDIEWLQFFHPFSSIETLFVAEKFAGQVSRTLEDIAEVTEVLPALDLLCLEDQPLSSVDKFVAIRWDSGHPVTVVNTKLEFERRLESYPPY
ncbi:hypothetical protein H4582DRAFT_2100070 [Lactarius indigo]|nr:hypothetical protein H4582DRAFT_2100070 [Lactarius indigo]